MYQVCTVLWYVLYQPKVHGVPTAGTPQNLRTYPNNSRSLGRQLLAAVRALL